MIKRTLASALIVLGILVLAAAPLSAGNDDKVTICHATSSETNPWVEITASVNAIFKDQGGHFYENGTPQAGHEQDYIGPCLTPTTSTPPSTVATTTTSAFTTTTEPVTTTSAVEPSSTTQPEQSTTTTLPETTTTAPTTTAPPAPSTTTEPSTTTSTEVAPTSTSQPGSTPTTAAPTTTDPVAEFGDLPRTGTNPWALVAIGCMAIAVGLALRSVRKTDTWGL